MRKQAYDLSQTIYGLASGSLPSAVAIIKVSGQQSFDFANRFFQPAEGELKKEKGVLFGKWVSANGDCIDECLLLSFVTPHSHTGEDVIEIQCHGSQAVVGAIFKQLQECGIRPAQNGEFSYRAYLNGKTTVEKISQLSDVFRVQEPETLNLVYRRKGEQLSLELGELRGEMVRLQAILDTAVDFSEEYSPVIQQAEAVIQRLSVRVERLLNQFRTVFSVVDRPKLVFAGSTNAGKSSLFNALLCRYRSIVSSIPGTTRDAIEAEIQLGNKQWKLIDTAGVRETSDVLEKEGIGFGEEVLSGASAWVLVVDGTQGLSASDRQLLQNHGSKPHLIAWNKLDLPGFNPQKGFDTPVLISAKTGDGLSQFQGHLRALTEKAVEKRSFSDDYPDFFQFSRLNLSSHLLLEMNSMLKRGELPEFIAEKNREALNVIQGLLGEVDEEEILTHIFSEFCIGK